MKSYRVTKPAVQIFPAALLSQRKAWENAAHLLPARTCLLVTDNKTPKQTELMRTIARSFRDDGWSVLIWMPPRRKSPVLSRGDLS